jgi:hypothetical protein
MLDKASSTADPIHCVIVPRFLPAKQSTAQQLKLHLGPELIKTDRPLISSKLRRVPPLVSDGTCLRYLVSVVKRDLITTSTSPTPDINHISRKASVKPRRSLLQTYTFKLWRVRMKLRDCRMTTRFRLLLSLLFRHKERSEVVKFRCNRISAQFHSIGLGSE